MLTIHAAGRWDETQVRVTSAPSTRPILPDVEAAIDAAWAAALARPGIHLFDGPMCRLERWHASPEALELIISHTTYKTFLGTNMANPGLADRHGPAVLANPVGMSAVLQSSDNFLVLGRRSASVAYYPNRVHPISGSLEPGDGANVFGAMRREIAEEAALSANDLSNFVCLGLVEDALLRQQEVIFSARVDRTLDAIGDSLDPTEHHALYGLAVTPAGVEEAIRDPALTPVAAGSFLLWGREAFGTGWFSQMIPTSVQADVQR
jgi:8-oxo-dGTP pyrophosphatase MutT (NUDIX family)